MSMPAVQFDDDDQPVLDPDSLKMPETAVHRRTIDLIGLAVTNALGSGARVFRDMNWYPADGSAAIAPDLMVLAADAVEASPRSYRQDKTGGPAPIAVVEVPSASDSFVSFRAKAFRLQRLGTVVYLVVPEAPGQAVLRLGPGDREPQPWTDRPIGELGGIRLGFDGGELVAETPAGLRGTSDADLFARAEQRAADSEQRAAVLEERAAAWRSAGVRSVPRCRRNAWPHYCASWKPTGITPEGEPPPGG